MRFFYLLQKNIPNSLEWFDVSFCFQAVCLYSCISEYDVGFFVAFNFPRLNYYVVAFANPDSSLYFSWHAAHSFLTVVAVNHHPCPAVKRSNYSNNFSFSWNSQSKIFHSSFSPAFSLRKPRKLKSQPPFPRRVLCVCQAFRTPCTKREARKSLQAFH